VPQYAGGGRRSRPTRVRNNLSEAELKANFDLAYHLNHVDTISARVFGKAA